MKRRSQGTDAFPLQCSGFMSKPQGKALMRWGDRRPSEARRARRRGVGIFKSPLSDFCPQATPEHGDPARGGGLKSWDEVVEEDNYNDKQKLLKKIFYETGII